MLRTILAASASAILAAGCAKGPGPTVAPGANPGIVDGSEVGAGAGESPLGAIEGGLIGADIGRSLDEEDRRIALQAEYEALEYGRSGRPVEWRSASSGRSGNVVVGAAYQVNRLDCREFTHNVSIDGRVRVARGTACRQPDGVWRVIG